MTTYQHGGDIAAFAKTCGCSEAEVIDLSSNINFIKPRIHTDFNQVDISPYPNYDALYQRLAAHYSVEPDELELFNGGSSAIFSFFRHIKKKHKGKQLPCVIYAPAYLEYKKAADQFGYELHLIDRFDHIDAEVPKGSLVIFVNPSTPDGSCYHMDALLSHWIEKECTILIDESFIEFTETPSMSNHIKKYDKLYILKSMTKFWGAAGIRIGALISKNINIHLLQASEPAWKISAFDAHYIQNAIGDTALAERTYKQIGENRDLLIEILENSPCVDHVFPSCANYLLVRLKTMDAYGLQQRLLPHRILIRNCENFDGLDRYYVRIAVKEKAYLEKLREVLDA